MDNTNEKRELRHYVIGTSLTKTEHDKFNRLLTELDISTSRLLRWLIARFYYEIFEEETDA